MDTATISAALSGLGALVVAVLGALSKRQTTDIADLREKASSLADEAAKAVTEARQAKDDLVTAEATIYRLRRLLAANGIDPGGQA